MEQKLEKSKNGEEVGGGIGWKGKEQILEWLYAATRGTDAPDNGQVNIVKNRLTVRLDVIKII